MAEGRGGGSIKLALLLLLFSEEAGGDDSGRDELLLEPLWMALDDFPEIFEFEERASAAFAGSWGLCEIVEMSCKRSAGDDGGREELCISREECGIVGGCMGEDSAYSDVEERPNGEGLEDGRIAGM